jgi:dTDP-4-amino-4,6-dideoxygalactose transaminase
VTRVALVRLSKSEVGAEEKAAIARVIDAGYLGMGAEVQAFEQEIRLALQTELEVICVATGTAALHLAVAELDIGPGDEVVIPSITYVASFQAVAATGATPIACDVDVDTGFIDLADAARRTGPKTRAIMPVHYASDAQAMDRVYMFAADRGLRVIEDAAHGFGGLRDGVKVGAQGDVLCFSFDGIKNITAGEGGAVVTGDPQLAQRVRDARLLGVMRDTEKRYAGERSWDFDVERVGFRYHMSNIMAALGREQLKKLPAFSARRRALVTRYRSAFAGSNMLRMLDLDYDAIVPHIFVLRVMGGRRDALSNWLRAREIECGMHYKPNHLLTRFSDGQPRPVAERLYEELISLPLHVGLTDADQDRVIAAIRDFLEATPDA